MQNHSQGRLICSTHGIIETFYDSTCNNCKLTLEAQRQHPKLANDSRIIDGKFENFRNGVL